MNILAVCSRNKIRSLTLEKLYHNRPELSIRSVGTSSQARRVISQKDLNWADIIVCMEHKHQALIHQKFQIEKEVPFFILDIEDVYQYMDYELIDAITVSFEVVLQSQFSKRIWV